MGVIYDHIGQSASFEQLAEEATELAHAALKCARISRGENPTPVKDWEAWNHLIEEFTDVVQCARELHLYPNERQIIEKTERFMRRWENSDNAKGAYLE